MVVHDTDYTNGKLVISDPANPSITECCGTEFFGKFGGYVILIEDTFCMPKNSKNKKKKLHYEILSLIPWKEKMIMISNSLVMMSIPIALIFSIQLIVSILYRIDNFSIALYMGLLLSIMVLYMLVSQYDVEKRVMWENKIIKIMMKKYFDNFILAKKIRGNNSDAEGIFWNMIISVSGIVQKFYLVSDILIIVLSMITLFFFSKIISAILAINLIIVFLIIHKQKNKIKNSQTALLMAGGALSSAVHDFVNSTFDIYCYSLDTGIKREYDRVIDNYQRQKESVTKTNSFFNRLVTVFEQATLIISLLYFLLSAKNVVNFDLQLTITSIYLMLLLFSFIKQAINKWIQYLQSTGAIEYIEDLAFDSMQDNAVSRQINEINIESLLFEGVDVSVDDKCILSNVFMEANKGEIIGITGNNGVGKSSFMNIILGFSDPSSGIIMINRHAEFQTLSSTNIKEYISVYSPEFYLYGDTAVNNINLNKYRYIADKKEEKFFSDMQDNVIVINDGKNISLGQKQKILLDRCFFQDKDIYILDEAGTNLDQNTREKFIETVNKLSSENKIIFLITHDKSIEKICHKVYEFKHLTVERKR